MKSRKRAGFHTIYDLWEDAGYGSSTIYHANVSSEDAGDNKTAVSPVFTDIFTSYTTATGQKSGMPILYFKANSTARFRANASREAVNPVSSGDFEEYSKWVYNFEDNRPILELPWLRDPVNETNGMAVHYPDEDDDDDDNEEPVQIFYEQLTQRQDGNFFKPYNKSTFLLISAGHDGIFGTKDDLTNFDD